MFKLSLGGTGGFKEHKWYLDRAYGASPTLLVNVNAHMHRIGSIPSLICYTHIVFYFPVLMHPKKTHGVCFWERN